MDDYLRSCKILFWLDMTEYTIGIGEGRVRVVKLELGCRGFSILILGDKDLAFVKGSRGVIWLGWLSRM